MSTNYTNGPLVVIGGHEEKSGRPDILRRFVALAGGDKADIAIMTCASTEPKEVGIEYEVVFTKLGAANVTSIHTRDCHEINEDVLKQLNRATAVFFVGGQPYRITEAIRHTPIDELLHRRRREGLVIAGTSAGALMMPDVVIMDGESRTNPSRDTIESGPGMGLLKDIVLDVHFAERGRVGRMLAALAKFPKCLGLAIDEDAALIIRGQEFEVVGCGSVFVFDPGAPEFKDITRAGCENIGLVGIRLHVLPAGCRFDLKRRKPCIASSDSEEPGDGKSC
jgi:cyanophycinase